MRDNGAIDFKGTHYLYYVGVVRGRQVVLDGRRAKYRFMSSARGISIRSPAFSQVMHISTVSRSYTSCISLANASNFLSSNNGRAKDGVKYWVPLITMV